MILLEIIPHLVYVSFKYCLPLMTDEKLDYVTSVPLISDVKRNFEIQLRIHIVEKTINVNN